MIHFTLHLAAWAILIRTLGWIALTVGLVTFVALFPMRGDRRGPVSADTGRAMAHDPRWYQPIQRIFPPTFEAFEKELAMPDPTEPIVVSASPAGAQAASGVTALALILSTLPALIAVLGTRDVMKIVAYLGSTEFAPVLGLLIAAGTIIWRQVRVRLSHQEKAALAEDASIGVLK